MEKPTYSVTSELSGSTTAFYPPAEDIVAKCVEAGLVMRTPAGEVTHPPITLQPFPIRRRVLDELYATQRIWNAAIDRLSRHPTFLTETLTATGASDRDFTGRLLELYQTLYLGSNAVFQPYMLGIFRADYMPSEEAGHHTTSSEGSETLHTNFEVLLDSASSFKNVEINTISVSFAGLSPLVSDVHAYLRAYDRAVRGGDATTLSSNADHRQQCIAYQELLRRGELERSVSHQAIPDGLALAHQTWLSELGGLLPLLQSLQWSTAPGVRSGGEGGFPLTPAVLVVVQEGERNTGDQHKLLLRLLEAHGILSIRRTLREIHASMELVEANALLLLPTEEEKGTIGTPEALLYERFYRRPAHRHTPPPVFASLEQIPPFAVLEGKYVVSVAYFRSTYVPQDFLQADGVTPEERCWATRRDLERCNGIKCPSLPHHLCTFKKVQQRMTERDILWIACRGDEQEAERLSRHFVGQFGLNPDEPWLPQHRDEASAHIQRCVEQAVSHPERYVLKPQLEGGGNLFAGKEMQRLLQVSERSDPVEYRHVRQEYILMERIHFPLRRVGVMKRGTLHGCGCCDEDNATTVAASPHPTPDKEGRRSEAPSWMSSELGIYGVILSRGLDCGAGEHETVVCNTAAGAVVRTKPDGVDDGGVMAGLSCLDSLVVVP